MDEKTIPPEIQEELIQIAFKAGKQIKVNGAYYRMMANAFILGTKYKKVNE